MKPRKNKAYRGSSERRERRERDFYKQAICAPFCAHGYGLQPRIESKSPMNTENRQGINQPATHMTTKATPITDKIRANGFRIYHNGRDLRLWPDGLSTQRQNEFIQQRRTAILAEIHSLWSNPVRCNECRHWAQKCVIRVSKPIGEGGWCQFDLHHCTEFENRDP